VLIKRTISLVILCGGASPAMLPQQAMNALALKVHGVLGIQLV
jgi:hypothetical protein